MEGANWKGDAAKSGRYLLSSALVRLASSPAPAEAELQTLEPLGGFECIRETVRAVPRRKSANLLQRSARLPPAKESAAVPRAGVREKWQTPLLAVDGKADPWWASLATAGLTYEASCGKWM